MFFIKKTTLILNVYFLFLISIPAIAGNDNIAIISNHYSFFAMSAAFAIGIAALGGTLGQAIAANSALSGIARNPEASGKIFVPMILSLALIESLVLFSLLIALLLLGKIS